MNQYIKNLETGKIELHFDKADYLKLSNEDKSKIKSTFLFSRFAGAWVSRAKDPNLYWPMKVAKELNLSDGGEQGEKLSFAQQVENFQDKAAARAERMETRAEKAERESAAACNNSINMLSVIPMGQPILVGHHSERGHRRLLEKSDNAMRRSVELDEKAKYYEGRAEAASYNASDARFKNVNYLLNRIAECNKHLRAIGRSLEGKDVIIRATGERMKDGFEISDERRTHLEGRKAEWVEKLDFFTVKLQEAGGGQLTAERLKEARPKYVKINKHGSKWWPLKSINRDTVTVLNWLGIADWTWKFKFDQIQSIEVGHVVEVLDRDGNKVEPTIKY